MGTEMKHWRVALMVVAIGFAAAGAQAYPTAAVLPNGNWTNPASWSTGVVPDSATSVVIGDANYPDVGVTVYSGTTAAVNDLDVGGYWDFGVAHYAGNGRLEIQPGATLEVNGRSRIGDGNHDFTGTLVVGGTLNQWDAAGMEIGGWGDAHVTFQENSSIHLQKMNAGHQSYMSEGWNYEIYQESGATVQIDSWGGGFYISSGMLADNTAYYRAADNTLINAHGMNGHTGFSTWHMGGTFDIAGAVTMDIPNGPAVFANKLDGPALAATTIPILKFSGTDPKLTVTTNSNKNVYFVNPLAAAGQSDPAQIDVSELTLSSADTWVTILDVVGGTLNDGNQAAFVAGTDANDWQIQAVGNQLQVKYTGDAACIMGDVNCSGLVDDDDLSLLLANWNSGSTWGTGDLNENGTVNDDDLSLLLANWGAGSSPAPEAVPEPMTITLLALGGLALIRRRSS